MRRWLREFTCGKMKCAQDAQETRQMTVIVAQTGFPGLRAVVGRVGRGVVLVGVVAEVLSGLVLFMSAIVGHRGPGYLEREKAEHDKHEQASHSRNSIVATDLSGQS